VTNFRGWRMARFYRVIGGWTLAIATVLGVSYCSELPKYRFEREAIDAGAHIPGARLISSAKSADLASPLSWIWPATTTFNFAAPDPLMKGRFIVITLRDDQDAPSSLLIDADCQEHALTPYDLGEPDGASPAIDVWGQPVVTPNGQTYRRLSTDIPLPTPWLRAFCDTDWTVERREAAAGRTKQTP
jgi:hypothetical protein